MALRRGGARAVQRRPDELRRDDALVARPRRRDPGHGEAAVGGAPGVEAQRVDGVALRPAAEAGRERVPVRPADRVRGRAGARDVHDRRRAVRRRHRARGHHELAARGQLDRAVAVLAHRERRRERDRPPQRHLHRAAGRGLHEHRGPPGAVAAVARVGRSVEARIDEHVHAGHRALSCPPRGARLGRPLHHRQAEPDAGRAGAGARGAPARLLPPHAGEHAQDARGAQRRGAGDALPGRPRRGHLGAPRGGADLRRRRRPDDRAGRRPARAGGRGGRPRRRRGAHGPARRAAGQARPHRRRHDRPAPRAGGDPRRRRQRHGQDDEHRQAGLAPAQDARAHASSSAPPTRSAPPRSSSSSAGASAPASTSSRAPRARTRARSPSTRSPAAASAAPTS